MKAKFSPLELKTFELLQNNYQFLVPKQHEIDVAELFKSYQVKIDFNHVVLEENAIKIFVKIEVNQLKSPKPGYSLFVEGLGIFQIIDSELPENILNNLKYYSTLNMMINNLRNIMFLTSNIGPLGGYLLPAIDIVDLFEKKNKESKKINS